MHRYRDDRNAKRAKKLTRANKNVESFPAVIIDKLFFFTGYFDPFSY